jgi:hypothetical protein
MLLKNIMVFFFQKCAWLTCKKLCFEYHDIFRVFETPVQPKVFIEWLASCKCLLNTIVWNTLSLNMCCWIDVKNVMYHGYVMAFKYCDIQILWCQTSPKSYRFSHLRHPPTSPPHLQNRGTQPLSITPSPPPIPRDPSHRPHVCTTRPPPTSWVGQPEQTTWRAELDDGRPEDRGWGRSGEPESDDC